MNESNFNEAVHVSVPGLVQLSRFASTLPLRSGQIMARQSGDYQSPFRGRGMEFDESRPYQPGDDIRNIDWRVTARTGKTYTKLFREERERPVFLWVDLSSSMFFATRGKYKSVQASGMASLLAWSAVHHGDRVGGIIFGDNVHHELKPHRGKTGVLKLINTLVKHPAWQDQSSNQKDKSVVGKALIRLRRVAKPGSLIFLLSDFRNFDEIAESQLIRLARHNDVVMVLIYDKLERNLPPAGLYRVSDGMDEMMLDTFDKKKADQYQERFEHHVSHLTQLSIKHSINFLICSTEDDPLKVLQSGLVARVVK